VRFFSPCSAASASAWTLALLIQSACGSDAERRYSDLSTAAVVKDEGGYRLRYPNPPWERRKEDPLATGARSSVTVGGTDREILPESAVVLEISKQSSAEDPEHLSLPKYRLEAALLRCDADEVDAGGSCARALAALDYDALAAEGDFDTFGPEPRAGENDFHQVMYEILGQLTEDQRYRRLAYFETSEPTLAARLFIEGNPDLGEREMTRLVQAFELTPAEEEP
jgi:hypothetical protein